MVIILPVVLIVVQVVSQAAEAYTHIEKAPLTQANTWSESIHCFLRRNTY